MPIPRQNTCDEQISIDSCYVEGRDPELATVFDTVDQRLRDIETLRGPAYDLALAWVEAFAAPYVLAFFYEIQRMDAAAAQGGRNAL